MKYTSNLTIRVEKTWLEAFGRLLSLTAKKTTNDRSRLIRQILAKEASDWLDSPYIALDQKSFFYVRKTGDVFFHNRQVLSFNHPRVKLPCKLEMKPEKLVEFRAASDEYTELSKRWIVNDFAIWEGDGNDRLITKGTDLDGGATKSVDLRVNRPQDTTVVRETTGGIRGYVQRTRDQPDLPAEDRGEVTIEIPTLNLQATAMVDREIYGTTFLASTAKLDREFRNLESAKLYNKNFAFTEEPVHWVADRYPDARYMGTEYEPAHRACKEGLARLSRALDRIRSSRSLNVGEEELAVPVPDRYLFGRLDWRMPHSGLKVCLTWNKPD